MTPMLRYMVVSTGVGAGGGAGADGGAGAGRGADVSAGEPAEGVLEGHPLAVQVQQDEVVGYDRLEDGLARIGGAGGPQGEARGLGAFAVVGIDGAHPWEMGESLLELDPVEI